MPTTSASNASIGIVMMHASTRGTTSFLTGSAPSARIASSCSVTAMEPISAAIPAPTRPPTSSAVSTGPSSITKPRLTSLPT